MSAIDPAARPDDGAASAESKGSSAPLLSKSAQPASALSQPSDSNDGTSKPRKRDFWKLGKKQEEDKSKSKEQSTSSSTRASGPVLAQATGLRPHSPLRVTESVGGSMSPPRQTSGLPGSPGMVSPSPRPHSPASSMIFERNVQDDIVPAEMSPQIPSHVITEDHIPPALDASADAITNEKLDPDAVEIVTHAQHQPAAANITGHEHSIASSMHEDMSQSQLPIIPHLQSHDTDNVSNYGSLDSTDVRRLSFISFADVVHAEHEALPSDQRRDSAHLIGHSATALARSPSPIRSPVSSQAFGTSPPTSISTSGGKAGTEVSPNRGARQATGSPLPGQSSPPPIGSELNIETMRQALRRTGSGDLRSAPPSAVGNEDGSVPVDKGFR